MNHGIIESFNNSRSPRSYNVNASMDVDFNNIVGLLWNMTSLCDHVTPIQVQPCGFL